MIYKIKLFFRRIKKIINWIPILWKNFDFDYWYIIEVFKYQLIRTADYLESNRAKTVSAKIHAQKIRTAIRLIDKVYGDDSYDMEYQKQLEDLYGKSTIEFIKIKDKDLYSVEIVYENKYDKKTLEEIEEKTKELLLKADQKQKRAHKLLWAFIEHNIQKWWD